MFARNAVAPPRSFPRKRETRAARALSAIWVPAFAGTNGCWTDSTQPGRTSVRGSILAPDSKRFLRRAIGDREQHRFLPHPMGIMLPRRHHEHVVRAPFEHLAVDRGGALPLGTDENGAVGGAVLLALEALGEEREVRAHGRQHRAAVDRVGVAHTRTMALVDVARLHHALDDRPRARVGVIDDGA